ncbi:MAG: SDR family NAD(P)-dependent oxidoreductase, partial [Kiloniellales bacterium]|nr:SDR family NAD(P)-dependent oxidoreductase [Kiloniellales bacterium]
MSFYKNPHDLFDVSDRVALVTGASGAFGAVAAKTLAGAGCKLLLSAGNEQALQAVADECRALGAGVETINLRPDTEANCQAMVDAAVAAFGRLDILLAASGMNKVNRIEDMPLEDFVAVMDANVTHSWMLARAATAH